MADGTSENPTPRTSPRRWLTREVFGWAMFDFANSSYTTVIVTVDVTVIATPTPTPPVRNAHRIAART